MPSWWTVDRYWCFDVLAPFICGPEKLEEVDRVVITHVGCCISLRLAAIALTIFGNVVEEATAVGAFRLC